MAIHLGAHLPFKGEMDAVLPHPLAVRGTIEVALVSAKDRTRSVGKDDVAGALALANKVGSVFGCTCCSATPSITRDPPGFGA